MHSGHIKYDTRRTSTVSVMPRNLRQNTTHSLHSLSSSLQVCLESDWCKPIVASVEWNDWKHRDRIYHSAKTAPKSLFFMRPQLLLPEPRHTTWRPVTDSASPRRPELGQGPDSSISAGAAARAPGQLVRYASDDTLQYGVCS